MGDTGAILQSLEKDCAELRPVLPENLVIIIGGADVITDYDKKLDREIAIYNRRLTTLSSPYFIRDRHTTSGGYTYQKRYVYKKVWDEEQQKIKDVYVGKVVPEDDSVPTGGFPAPPINILEGFRYRVIHHDIICSRAMYDKFFRFFIGKNIVTLPLKI